MISNIENEATTLVEVQKPAETTITQVIEDGEATIDKEPVSAQQELISKS